jgi:hypothetical protein
MKKVLVIFFTVIMVFASVAVAMAAVTTSGFIRLSYDNAPAEDASNTTGDTVANTQVRLNLDDNVNDQLAIHTQVRAYSCPKANSDNADVYVYDYYAKVDTKIGTFQIGQWENDFWGDTGVIAGYSDKYGPFDLFSDSIWMTPAAIQFSPKLSGGFSAALWYNPANSDASLPVKNGGFVAAGEGAYTASVDYANGGLSLELAYGSLGDLSKSNQGTADKTSYDGIVIANASYTFKTFKVFAHYADEGKNNPIIANKELKDEIIGINAAIPNTGFSAQAEYDFATNPEIVQGLTGQTKDTDGHPYGIGLYYTAKNMTYTYAFMTIGGQLDYHIIRAQYNF